MTGLSVTQERRTLDENLPHTYYYVSTPSHSKDPTKSKENIAIGNVIEIKIKNTLYQLLKL